MEGNMHISDVLKQVKFPLFRDWELNVVEKPSEIYLQVVNYNGRCAITDVPLPWSGRKWRLSVHMTESELVGTAFAAIKQAVEHEVMEHFTYKGVQVFDPHRSIQALLQLDGVRDVRK
jgi:hypothetical protein